jgi:hypothetical protein
MVEWMRTDERKYHAMGLRRKKSLIDQASDIASDIIDDAKPKIEAAVTTAKDKALPLLADAKDKAAPVLADAKAKAGPVLADAKAKAGPALAGGAAIAADKASAGATIAAEKAAIARDLASEKAAVGRDLAATKVAELKGEKPKKGGKLKKLLIVTGLAAAGAVIAKKLRGGDSTSDNWQSSYVPTPAPAPAKPATPSVDSDDAGGSSPDEAIADAAEQPHSVSTPDDPAETVTIDEDAAKKS